MSFADENYLECLQVCNRHQTAVRFANRLVTLANSALANEPYQYVERVAALVSQRELLLRPDVTEQQLVEALRASSSQLDESLRVATEIVDRVISYVTSCSRELFKNQALLKNSNLPHEIDYTTPDVIALELRKIASEAKTLPSAEESRLATSQDWQKLFQPYLDWTKQAMQLAHELVGQRDLINSRLAMDIPALLASLSAAVSLFSDLPGAADTIRSLAQRASSLAGGGALKKSLPARVQAIVDPLLRDLDLRIAEFGRNSTSWSQPELEEHRRRTAARILELLAVVESYVVEADEIRKMLGPFAAGRGA